MVGLKGQSSPALGTEQSSTYIAELGDLTSIAAYPPRVNSQTEVLHNQRRHRP